MSSDEEENKINKQSAIDRVMLLYSKQGYFNLYGPTIIYFIFMIFVLFLVISFTKTMMNIKNISNNWETERCSPSVMPFAGFINLPKGTSFFDYTSENYQYCVQQILTSISGDELEPLNFVTSSITSIFSLVVDALNSIRSVIAEIRGSISSITEEISTKIINVLIPFQTLIIKMSDVFNKSQAVLTAGIYTLFGIYYSVKSFFDAFVTLLFTLLIALVILILLLLIFFTPAAAPWIVIFAGITIPLGLILNFVSEVFGTPSFPSMPTLKCFDKNTKLKLQNGKDVSISDIQIGDILNDGSIIHCHVVLDRGNEDMYNLNGVIVSGTHRLLYKNKWICVADYPNIEKISDYNEPFLYCVNTSNKIIKLNGMVFSDWDDILVEDKYLRLLRNIGTEESRLDKIHSIYNKGFPSDTLIEMRDGTMKLISDINVGDELKPYNSNQPINVYGKVLIHSHDLVYGNLLDNTIKYTKDLGGFYHLLTVQGYFYINGNKYFDYNSCVDLYVD